MRFLDVAAGSGALSIPAARLGGQVLATDQSPVMLELLRARAGKEKLNIETRVMDGQALELGDKYFLCAVDYAFNDDDYQFYFIRDPANQVANFAFDSPWKTLAVPMNAFLSRIKDKQGIVS